MHLLKYRVGREGEASVADAIHHVERDLLDLLALEHHKVVLADQQEDVGDDNQALLFVVPVIHPEIKHAGFA